LYYANCPEEKTSLGSREGIKEVTLPSLLRNKFISNKLNLNLLLTFTNIN